jgi:DNA ligase-associated metallophosphoesterase
MHHSIQIRSETLDLLPGRAIFWARSRILLVADAHFGKAATFRARGLPVPRGTTLENLDRLSDLIAQWQPLRIVFLGDFLHAREAHAAATLQAMRRWRARHADVDITLVRGNHDAKAGDPPEYLGIQVVTEPYVLDPFALCHHPVSSVHGYVLAGHLHPSFHVPGRAYSGVTLPCFWFGREVGVLPAFGSFTGNLRVRAADGETVYVVAPDAVHPMPTRNRA